jgi:DNA replication licensing factor MCM5
MVLQERPEDVPTGDLPRSLTATCDRTLVGTVSPGTRVTILGVYAINTGTDKDKKKGNAVAIRQPYVRCVNFRYLTRDALSYRPVLSGFC